MYHLKTPHQLLQIGGKKNYFTVQHSWGEEYKIINDVKKGVFITKRGAIWIKTERSGKQKLYIN